MKYKVAFLKQGKDLAQRLLVLAIGLCMGNLAFGLTFPLPQDGDIVGEIQTTTVGENESLGEIGRRFDVGVYEMIEANPNIDPWVPTAGTIVVIPTQFILPKVSRNGLVLNLAEMRLYYFHFDKPLVTTYPLGVGKKGWSTPLGMTVITGKKKNPPWHPPESIRREHLAKGDVLPAVISGGISDNPLGLYALYLNKKGLSGKGDYLIHGTNRPAGIGVRGTHGCIRLFPEDIQSLYDLVPIGTQVRIIHEPYKVGWHNKRLYLEAHQPLTEFQYSNADSIKRLEKLIQSTISDNHMVNWTSAKMFAKTANGYPVRID